MTLAQKKRKAAVIAVSCYAQMQTSINQEVSKVWGKMGISRIMSGRDLPQRRGKTLRA